MSSNQKQSLLFEKETLKKELLQMAKKASSPKKTGRCKENFLKLLRKTERFVFEIMTEKEKEQIWQLICNDMDCLLRLAKKNCCDVFPEKAFNFVTLNEIFFNGANNIIDSFVHSQYYREGMKKFLMCEKHRQLIMDKIGSETYFKFIEDFNKNG